MIFFDYLPPASPPDYVNIPTGISKSMGIGGIGEKLIEYTARGYLKLTENSAGVVHKAASKAFHDNDVMAPSLWFYSESDPVAVHMGTTLESLSSMMTPHLFC